VSPCAHDETIHPQRIIDDRAFPIRIQFLLPWNGFGQRLNVYLAWLNRLGSTGLAQPAGA
jgi:hypothetical protein